MHCDIAALQETVADMRVQIQARDEQLAVSEAELADRDGAVQTLEEIFNLYN